MRLAAIFLVVWIGGAVIAPAFDATGWPAPDLLLVVLVAAAVARGPRWGAWTGLALGAIADLLSLGRFGPTASAYALAGWTAGFLGRRFVARTRGLVAAAAIAAAGLETAFPLFCAAAGFAVPLLPAPAAARVLLVGGLAPAAAALDRPPETE